MDPFRREIVPQEDIYRSGPSSHPWRGFLCLLSRLGGEISLDAASFTRFWRHARWANDAHDWLNLALRWPRATTARNNHQAVYYFTLKALSSKYELFRITRNFLVRPHWHTNVGQCEGFCTFLYSLHVLLSAFRNLNQPSAFVEATMNDGDDGPLHMHPNILETRRAMIRDNCFDGIADMIARYVSRISAHSIDDQEWAHCANDIARLQRNHPEEWNRADDTFEISRPHTEESRGNSGGSENALVSGPPRRPATATPEARLSRRAVRGGRARNRRAALDRYIPDRPPTPFGSPEDAPGRESSAPWMLRERSHTPRSELSVSWAPNLRRPPRRRRSATHIPSFRYAGTYPPSHTPPVSPTSRPSSTDTLVRRRRNSSSLDPTAPAFVPRWLSASSWLDQPDHANINIAEQWYMTASNMALLADRMGGDVHERRQLAVDMQYALDDLTGRAGEEREEDWERRQVALREVGEGRGRGGRVDFDSQDEDQGEGETGEGSSRDENGEGGFVMVDAEERSGMLGWSFSRTSGDELPLGQRNR